jgi:FADH2 O2-dependent halogenase
VTAAFDCDLAIVGSGFGGSVLAMVARRLGYRVLLLERGCHPRFAIGESASPLAGILIEQIADRYGLPRLAPLATFGAWQRTYPEVACGLKRGFTFFEHHVHEPYRVAPRRMNQLLVAASPNDEVSDTHWLRSDVDHFLVREAIALGADYLDGVELERLDWHSDPAARKGPAYERGTTVPPAGARSAILRGTRQSRPVRVHTRFVIDATGPRGFLSRVLGIHAIGFEAYPATHALFSHFTGVARCGDMPEYGMDAPPYPADDAALHHVFDGGWMWVLRFGNGVTSAGVAVTDALAADIRIADGAAAWRRLLERYPTIAAQFAGAQPIRDFAWMPRLAWRAEIAAGPGWAMLPSAAAFIDPLFSTGIPLTLLGIERLARILEGQPFGDYSDITLAEADHTARFIAGCYAAFPRFRQFTAYSMFYFAAASYAEMARRLRVQPDSARFLYGDRERFAKAVTRLSPRACDERVDDYESRVAAAVEPVNIAGLCDPAKNNWYGIDPGDAIAGAAKLGVTRDAVMRALVAAGVPPTVSPA